MSAPYELPIVIRQKDGVPYVELAGQEISLALGCGGVKIEYVDLFDGGGPQVPQVTLTFAPGALALDFEVDLLKRLLSEKSA